MAKITLIGAGSTGFSKRFISDILTRPALAEGTLSLMDINQDYLDITTALAKKMAKQLGVGTKIESSTDRRRALEGSDYVISVILLHGLEARMVEHKIPTQIRGRPGGRLHDRPGRRLPRVALHSGYA